MRARTKFRAEVPPDGDLPRQGWPRSLRTRLIVSFSLLFAAVLVVLAMVGVWGLPFTGYAGWKGLEVTDAFRSLELVADLKQSRLQRMLKERRDDIFVFAGNDMVRANVARLRAAFRRARDRDLKGEALWAAVRRESSYRALDEYIRVIATGYGVYREILIADADSGTILASLEAQYLGADVSDEPFFTGLSGTDYTFVSDIEVCRRSGMPALHLSRAIEDIDPQTLVRKEGALGALLVLELNPDDIIKPMLHTGEGLGRTGEALLVNKEVRIVTSLRHPLADGRRAKPLEYCIRARPAELAATGHEGIIEAEDYRGEPVLAAYRYIPVTDEWGWGLVVKRDRAELFAPLRGGLIYSMGIGLAGVAVLVGLTVVLARALTGPIMSLSGTAEKIAGGDLAARAAVIGSDEVGHLAATFNTMIQRIQNWHGELEEQVRARTAELNRANLELRAEMDRREQAEQDARRAQERLLSWQRQERELVEAELAKVRGALVRQTRLATLGHLAGSIAHELRNPLGSVRNAAYFLKSEVLNQNPRWAKHLRVIEEEVCTADRIIRELLEMSRAKEPHKAWLDLGRVLQTAWERARLPDGVQRRVTLDPEPFTVYADATQLGQVLGNLLLNASQAMGGDGEIQIEAQREQEYDLIVVRDNGPGVPPEDRERVFEPLFSTRAKGTGLGLAISRQILERHGGALELLDQGGPGAAFRLRVPREY